MLVEQQRVTQDMKGDGKESTNRCRAAKWLFCMLKAGKCPSWWAFKRQWHSLLYLLPCTCNFQFSIKGVFWHVKPR